MPFYKWSEIPKVQRAPQRAIRPARGDKGMVVRVEQQGPSVHEPHVHDENEQVVVVLEGEMEMLVGDETRTIGPADVVVVPPGVPHGVRVAAGVDVVRLEFFAPPRRDV